jgi:plastocyanin
MEASVLPSSERDRAADMVRAMRRTVSSILIVVGLGLGVAACSSDDGASGCSPATAELAVGAEDDLRFDADRYETSAGCIEVTYTNNGNVSHSLLVRGKSGFKLNVGDVDKGTLDLPPGSYELYCDVAGHEAGGMVADLEVGPAPADG